MHREPLVHVLVTMRCVFLLTADHCSILTCNCENRESEKPSEMRSICLIGSLGCEGKRHLVETQAIYWSFSQRDSRSHANSLSLLIAPDYHTTVFELQELATADDAGRWPRVAVVAA